MAEWSAEICNVTQVSKWILHKGSTGKRERWKRTLFSRMLAASALPSSPLLRCEMSRPAVVRTASTAALVNSNPVRVASRAPAIHNPPTRVPTLIDNEETPVTVLTKAATGPGSSVLPEDATRLGRLSVEHIWSAAGSLSRACPELIVSEVRQ